MGPRRFGFHRRFSLGEVLVAVAVDAVLAATILEWARYLRGENATYYVSTLVVALTYVVFPCVVVPWYFATYYRHGGAARGWHSPRNHLLMVLDVAIVALGLVGVAWKDSNRTRDVQLVYLFLPITYTMYLAYSLIVGSLRRRVRPPGPAPGAVAAIAVEPPAPAARPESRLVGGPGPREPGRTRGHDRGEAGPVGPDLS